MPSVARDVAKIGVEVRESLQTDEFDKEGGELIVEFLKAESVLSDGYGKFLSHSHPQLMSNQASKDLGFKMISVALPVERSGEIERLLPGA